MYVPIHTHTQTHTHTERGAGEPEICRATGRLNIQGRVNVTVLSLRLKTQAGFLHCSLEVEFFQETSVFVHKAFI